MLEGNHNYVYTREGDCHRLTDLIDNTQGINVLVEDNNIYQRIINVEKSDKSEEYYEIMTDSGKNLIMADNNEISVRIDNPNGPDKEKRFVTVDLMKKMIDNNEPVNIYVSNNNFSAEMNEHINKRRGSFYEGLVLALLLAPDSKLYLNNPNESYIQIRFLNDFQPKNLKKWISDLTYSKYLEYLFGGEFILNCKSRLDRETIPNEVLKIDKYKFDDILDTFINQLFGYTIDYWNDKDKESVIGFSSVFDKEIKKIDETILRFILTKTTYQFKSGLFQTIAQIYTTNMFEPDWKLNEFRTKDELLLKFMENVNYLYSSQYAIKRENGYYNFVLIDKKFNYTKVVDIKPYKNIINPVRLNVFKQNFISNGFEFLIL